GFARPTQACSIEYVVLTGEANIFRSKGLILSFAHMPFADLRATLTIAVPVPCPVNRLAIDTKTFPKPKQAICSFIRNRAIRLWANIQQQVAILTHNVHQIMDQCGDSLEVIVFDITPGFVTYRGIGLPVRLADVVELAAFNIIKCRSYRKSLEFVL